MKREIFAELGITDADVINRIMAENGKDIEKVKANYADYEANKAELEKAQKTIEGFGDVDAIKADVEKYKAEAKLAKETAEKEINNLRLSAQVKDFTGNKKFVNEITRDSINSQLLELLGKEESKGKSLDDLLKNLTDGKENIFVEDKPEPPKTISLSDGGANDATAEKNAVRAVMGLPPIK